MAPESGEALVARLLAADGTLDRRALLEILPYGEDFLFVDRVTRLAESEIDAEYRVPADAPWIRAHFDGFPIMPGALIAEGFAQAGTVLVRRGLEDPAGREILGLQIERASFSHPAYPGDVLEYRARLATSGRRAARLEGEVRVAGRRAADLKLAVAVVDRELFRREAGRVRG